MINTTIAIIGAGNMGASLLGGLIANEFPCNKLWITDPDPDKLEKAQKQFQINIAKDNQAAIEAADVVLFAVKPQLMANVSRELAKTISRKKPLVISIAAGVRESSIQEWLGGNIAIVRAMPNTPALIGCGATALFANKFVSDEQHSVAESILRAVSQIVWINDEKLMDTITALSGSGPAYFFLVMEALENTAIELGLPQETARLLTLQTAYGSVRLAMESDVDVVELRKRVTSPGGTTEKALEVLEKKQLRQLFKEALAAAKQRSEELADLFGKSPE